VLSTTGHGLRHGVLLIPDCAHLSAVLHWRMLCVGSSAANESAKTDAIQSTNDRTRVESSRFCDERRICKRRNAHRNIDSLLQKAHDAITSWIEQADACFVASAHPDGAMDASHRGGARGFVALRSGVLRIPDYPGNSLFNTLGNFSLNPRAGLVFLHFEHSRQLQLSGDVRLDLAARDTEGTTGGTGRWWAFHPRRWIVSPLDMPLAWRFADASPFNP